jgi:hypothetical protein
MSSLSSIASQATISHQIDNNRLTQLSNLLETGKNKTKEKIKSAAHRMVTLIIPTFDRPALLLRAIDYYKYFDCSVLIVDSSDNRSIHKFPDNIVYKHLPKACWTRKIY